MTQRFTGEQQRAQEAAREVAHPSMDAYMDFLDSMFVLYRAGVKAAERGTGEG